MQEFGECETKILTNTKTFQKNVDDILKMMADNKCKLYRELETIKFFELLMSTNQIMCDMKCKITQMRYDLYEMKNNKKDSKDNTSERNKIIVLLYQFEETFEEVKKKVFKELKAILEKGDKMKFTMEEIKVWTELSNFIRQIIERMSL